MCGDVSQEPTYVGTFRGNVHQACKVTCIYYEWKHLSASSSLSHTHTHTHTHTHINRKTTNCVRTDSVYQLTLCAALSLCDKSSQIILQIASMWVKTHCTFAWKTDEAPGWYCELLPTDETRCEPQIFEGLSAQYISDCIPFIHNVLCRIISSWKSHLKHQEELC